MEKKKAKELQRQIVREMNPIDSEIVNIGGGCYRITVVDDDGNYEFDSKDDWMAFKLSKGL